MLELHETFTNATEGHHLGDSGWYEPFTDNRKRLFRSYQRDYGRCISAIYQDTPTGSSKIGWYFEKMMEYEYCRPRYNDYGRQVKPETYIRGVWVTYRDLEQEQADKEIAYYEAADVFHALA